MELQDFAPIQMYSQLAYKSPEPAIVDLRGATASAMREHLELPSVSLHPTAAEVTSEDGHDQFRIGLQQIYASIIDFEGFEHGRDRTRDFLSMAISHMSEPAIEGVNVRLCDVAPAESFDALRDRMNETLVPDIAGLRDAVGVKIEDSAWVFEVDDAAMAGRVQFGPMKSSQLRELLGVSGGIHEPPSMLFLMTDLKFPCTDPADGLGHWEKSLERQRGIVERVGSWLTQMLS